MGTLECCVSGRFDWLLLAVSKSFQSALQECCYGRHLCMHPKIEEFSIAVGFA